MSSLYQRLTCSPLEVSLIIESNVSLPSWLRQEWFDINPALSYLKFEYSRAHGLSSSSCSWNGHTFMWFLSVQQPVSFQIIRKPIKAAWSKPNIHNMGATNDSKSVCSKRISFPWWNSYDPDLLHSSLITVPCNIDVQNPPFIDFLRKPSVFHIYLVGVLKNVLCFSIYWECHHPNWLIFVRGVGQPPTSYVSHVFFRRTPWHLSCCFSAPRTLRAPQRARCICPRCSHVARRRIACDHLPRKATGLGRGYHQ